jgi:aminopeptidase N
VHTSSPYPGAASLGDPFYPDLGNGGYDVLGYAVALTWRPPSVDHPAGSADVTTVIDAVATQPLSELSFDLVRSTATLRAIQVDGVDVEPLGDPAGQKLVLRPETPIPDQAAFRVRVAATVEPGTVPKTGLEDPGVLAGSPATVDRVGGRGLLSDLDGGMLLAAQPNGAHALLPLNDHPTDKAELTVTITAPPGMLGVATGRLDRLVTGPDGSVTTTYRSGHPVATHVISIGVGRYTLVSGITASGVPLRFAIPSAFAEAPEWRLDAVPEAIAWLEAELGPYPLDAAGIMFSPPGASAAILEGQTLVLMPATVFDPQVSDCAWRSLLAHELSHQWFGDSVSLTRWDEKWLSEGHATFTELRWAADSGCDPRPFSARMRQAYRHAQAVRDASGPPARPHGPADAYGSGIYEQGALALFALREEVGEEGFDAIEREYLARFRDGNASTAEFIDVASEVAGRDLRRFLRAWLYGDVVPPMPGHPAWISNAPAPSPSAGASKPPAASAGG